MEMKALFTQNKKQFILYIIGVLIIAPSDIMITFALANAFNLLEANSGAEIIKIALLSVALGYIPIALQVMSRFLRIGFMRDVLVQVRMLSYKKLLSKNISEFKSETMESYQSQLVSDINLFENDFFLAILRVVYSLFNFAIGVTILFFISPLIAILTTIMALTLFLLSKLFEKPTIEKKQKVLQENIKFHESLTNILRGLETIKLYRVTNLFKNTFLLDIAQLEKQKKASYQISNIQENIMTWLAGTYQVFTIIYAAYLFSIDQIGLSSLVVVFNLIGQLIWSLRSGFSMINRYKTSKDIFNKIAKHDEVTSSLQPFVFNESISVNNLTYCYKDHCVLNDINLTINKNEKVLIYGPSGTGKTTLINTLTQNLNDYSGEIFYDNLSLKLIDFQSLNDNIGYIRQEHFIFDDSIRNNIVLNQPYNEAKFLNVLKMAVLSDWVFSLDLKTDYLLYNNGSNISGGQRQRINIARELYQDKSMLIFDEPSSSLDDATAYKIYKTIKQLDKTILVISHRHIDILSKNFDKVVDLSKMKGIQNA